MAEAFSFPAISAEQQALAQSIYEHFETLFDRGPDGGPIHRNPAEVIVKHPDYAKAKAALGTRCAFAFSGDTYDNDDFTHLGLDDVLGERVVMIYDPRPVHLTQDEPRCAWDWPIHEILESAGWERQSDLLWANNVPERTLRQATQSLLDLGLYYNPTKHDLGEQNCIYRKKLVGAGAINPQPPITIKAPKRRP